MLNDGGYSVVDLSDDEMAKLHVRYMVVENRLSPNNLPYSSLYLSNDNRKAKSFPIGSFIPRSLKKGTGFSI